ncbi:MAG: hypothetical protein ACI9ZD_001230 [Paracoccaceae bacterium]|jgi:hypothetical protein
MPLHCQTKGFHISSHNSQNDDKIAEEQWATAQHLFVRMKDNRELGGARGNRTPDLLHAIQMV